MHWIDITLIAILIIFALVGLKRGFINAILSLFGTVASGFIAWWLSKPFAGFIEQIFHVTQHLSKFVSNMLVGWNETLGTAVEQATTTGTVISNSGLGTWQQVVLKMLVGDKAILEGEIPANVFANIISPIILIVLAGIVAFFLIKLAVFLLTKLFDALKKNHAFGSLDKILGFAFGLLKGALIVCVAMGITIFIPNQKVIEEIDKTTVTKIVYEPVTNFIRDNVADKLREWAEQIMPKETAESQTDAEAEATETSYTISVYSDSVLYKD